MTLPIEPILPALVAALRAQGQAVLQAPPGAGKTTRVPLALLEAGVTPQRIIMLEPRRLAARAAADRLASSLGEKIGGQVGLRMRGQSKPGKRIEVVTEGVLTRMLQDDPELPGVGALLFDEFHERSLNADLGLALALEVRATLRPDLIILPMSATLDAKPVAQLMAGAPVITAEGRSFPVDLRWRDTPLPARTNLEAATTDTIRQAISDHDGSILVFLPGAREIRKVAALLGTLPDVDVRPLYGALSFTDQRAAIAPGPRRKIVLATSIAETSLTIEDIRIVVDAGRARRARFDPGSGMSRLVTEPVSRAEATQRAGRAGRVAPGLCYRLWTKGQEGALPAFPPAEIEAADLTSLALDLAAWGTAEGDLAFLTPPPAGALAEARRLLNDLGVLQDGRITDHGRAVTRLPLHPRLAHMVAIGGRSAALQAALMAGRDPLRSRQTDLGLRLRTLKDGTRTDGTAEIRAEAKRIAALTGEAPKHSIGELAALAYPDRIGKRRPGDAPRYILSGGRGATLPLEDDLASQPYIVATDLDGHGRDATIRMAAPITEGEIRGLFADRIDTTNRVEWSRRDRRVLARTEERLGALTLSSQTAKDTDPDEMARAMCDGIRDLGLRLPAKAQRFCARVERVRATGVDLPEMTETALLDTLEDWLLPYLTGITSAEHWKAFDPLPALRDRLDWTQTQALQNATPSHFTTPLGRRIEVDYSGDVPAITLRLQEMFGVTTHPVICGEPVKVTLTSPAGKPVQTTRDIPGFWASSYADVRRDMRGRYPRHPWPEDPTQADPTLRAKRRGE